jgi:hypothetical protein
MPYCGVVDVFLGGTLVATIIPSGTMGVSGHFSAPSTLGTHNLMATGAFLHSPDETNPALCLASARIDVVAAPTPTGVSAVPPESESSPAEPEAGTAPVSATPLHVTG